VSGTESYLATLMPVYGSAIISIAISLVITYAIIRLVGVEKISEFLKPNTYKISITIIALTILVVIGAIIGFYYAAGNPNDPVLDGTIDVLMLGANYLNGFMIWLFPIIAYYLIVCLIYNKYLEKKELLKNSSEVIHQ
jgi:hypothetical protein